MGSCDTSMSSPPESLVVVSDVDSVDASVVESAALAGIEDSDVTVRTQAQQATTARCAPLRMPVTTRPFGLGGPLHKRRPRRGVTCRSLAIICRA